MKSIRARLTRTLLRVLTGLLVAGLVLIDGVVWNELVHAFDSSLRSRAQAVAALTEIEKGVLGFDFSEDFLASYRAQKPRNYFQLRNATGVVVARSPSLGATELASASQRRESGRPLFWNLRLPNGRSGRAVTYTFSPTVSDTTRVLPSLRTLEITVAADREELNEMLWGLFFATAGSGLVLAGAVWIVVPRLLRNGLAPLDELAEATTKINANSLQTRFDVSSLPLELQPIAQRLNDLLGRLEQSFERERRFSADLAHELRTPLAELRSMAECAIKWPDSRGENTDRDTLAIAEQMERLVVHILSLTRGEQSDMKTKNEVVPVSDLLGDVWKRYAERAAKRDLRILLSLPPVSAQGDRALLTAILNNLCENAVDYTPEGCEIGLSVRIQNGVTVIEIYNTTRELRAEDVSKLFHRFWRKEAARSDGNHAGLGLSLARSFAQAMGWNLEATLKDERLTFELTEPMRPAPLQSRQRPN